MSGVVVSRPLPKSNIGSNLASLAGAAWLARRLERTLVVDWRGLSQLRDPALNYFGEFLATPGELDDVPVLYAPADVDDYAHARPLEPDEAGAIVHGIAEPPPGPIVLETYHGPDRLHPGPEAERVRFLRRFYRSIRLRDELERTVDEWWGAHAVAPFVVAVNVRTGNGRYFGKGMPYASRVDVSLFDDRRRFLVLLERACRRAARRLPRPLRESFTVFYATDSSAMSDLLGGLPNAVTRRTVFPPPGSGDTFAFPAEGTYTDRDAIVDTLADMFLLARADALLFNSSMFNQYARVTRGQFGGNLQHIELLLLRNRARVVRAAVERRIRR